MSGGWRNGRSRDQYVSCVVCMRFFGYFDAAYVAPPRVVQRTVCGCMAVSFSPQVAAHARSSPAERSPHSQHSQGSSPAHRPYVYGGNLRVSCPGEKPNTLDPLPPTPLHPVSCYSSTTLFTCCDGTEALFSAVATRTCR